MRLIDLTKRYRIEEILPELNALWVSNTHQKVRDEQVRFLKGLIGRMQTSAVSSSDLYIHLTYRWE